MDFWKQLYTLVLNIWFSVKGKLFFRVCYAPLKKTLWIPKDYTVNAMFAQLLAL